MNPVKGESNSLKARKRGNTDDLILSKVVAELFVEFLGDVIPDAVKNERILTTRQGYGVLAHRPLRLQ